MPYTIKLLNPATEACANTLHATLLKTLESSRFTAAVSRPEHAPTKGWLIIVRPVRLREKKPYCGQHPGECQVSPFGERKKLNGRWLECARAEHNFATARDSGGSGGRRRVRARSQRIESTSTKSR